MFRTEICVEMDFGRQKMEYLVIVKYANLTTESDLC